MPGIMTSRSTRSIPFASSFEILERLRTACLAHGSVARGGEFSFENTPVH